MSKKISFFVEPHKLANKARNEPILLALSGGADSSCLLHLLAEYSVTVGCKLYAVHVNHNIRTEAYSNEAYRDEQFCRDLCSELGIELFVHSIDIPSLAKESGVSLETAARDARYEYFATVMSENSINILATAHNADDNLETQIFNLCRGCSVDGLCGIPRQRTFESVDGAVIVRPILDATKAEILDFCKSNNIHYVTDSTNLEDDCTRNRIRHNIIPELMSLFGNPQRAAMRLAVCAEQDSDALNCQAQAFLNTSDNVLLLDRVNSLHPSIAKRVIGTAFKNVCNARLEAVHIDGIIAIAKSGKEGSAVSLPQQKRAIIQSGKIIFEDDIRECEKSRCVFDVKLTEGINLLNGSPFAVRLSKATDDTEPCDIPDGYEFYDETVTECSSAHSLHARSRREGDEIFNRGMHKKLKKLMCDKKIALSHRALIPIICTDEDIIYVPRCATADKNSHSSCDSVKFKITILKTYGDDRS